MNFIEFAVDRFITDAKQARVKKVMLEIFRTETDEELMGRIFSAMDGLEMAFVMETRQPLIVHNRVDNTRMVLDQLKSKLAPEIAAMAK